MSGPIGITITGEAVAAPFRNAITSVTATASPKPKLVGLLATNNAPSRAYAEWTAKACKAVGIDYELREIKPSQGGEGAAEQSDVEEAILEANADAGVHGIMVYYPIFGPRQDVYLQQAVSPLKDVEGLNFTWLFSLYHNARFIDPRRLGGPATQIINKTAPSPAISDEDGKLVKAILPCTPLAMVKCLEHCQVYNPLLPYGSRAFGRTITVVNRSEVVGRPLAALLSNDGARVFSVDLDGIQEFTRRKAAEDGSSSSTFLPQHVSRSIDMTLEECLAISDVVPSKEYKIKTDSLKEGVVAINFSESKNFETTIKEKASLYCPGIGKATIVMLQRNLLRLRDYQDKLAAEA
ncbi:hypothetical protein MNV49_006902 [Pseudohyphozyma bogoriensis]|nr:hypothetical protein MNV49_006902 [Pseudohyphozyma bogoriensis]